MNMDEFLNSVWDAEGDQTPSHTNQSKPTTDNNVIDNIHDPPSLSPQTSFSLPNKQLCNKTMDEVWFEIHKDQPKQQSHGNLDRDESPPRQKTFEEMTLEDFLIKAGVVQSGSSLHNRMPLQSHYGTFASSGNAGFNTDFGGGNVMGSGLISNLENTMSNISSDSLAGYHMITQSAKFVGESSKNGENGNDQSGGLKSRRRMMEGSLEVVVERRQRRMIKNRESAARSRARKQAYTVELEVEMNRLKEENTRLKQTLVEAEQKRRHEVIKLIKRKQSTKAQKVTEKLRTMRRSVSLVW
ncbi:ABSCISIC ACID-INSENSITIVE 5-like protein 1 isoform X2 [Malania oleifera]|uniref:ABSCISIC ACID-INSENSITIVE 5-like protein 1 isoform X2 n=1 Tax=Malania oleifera TaxID=397392 RepID=UPI0025AE87B5|nr:ABSCISIC ACID-INSENSITIVE 5-like protein 1 isoform X2 [Malania oleifera]